MTLKRVGFVIGVLALIALLWYMFRPAPPDTLLQAVRNHPEVFPAGYRVVMPLSAASRLGQGLEAPPDDLPATDYGVTTGVPCFVISPTTAGSLNELRVKYTDNRTFGAEAEAAQVSGSAGLTLSKNASAEMVLRDLRVEHGIGWPNLNSPCKFDQPNTQHLIVTGQVVAKSVTFTMSSASTGQGNAGAGAAAQAGGKVSTGWKSTTDRESTGENIVVSALVSSVNVSTTDEIHELGPTPQPGSTFRFPGGLDGSITLDEFDASTNRVKFRAAVPGNATQVPSAGLNVCGAGATLERELGARCDFWLPPGTSLVSASWELKGNGASRQVVLWTRSYRTTFPPSPAR